MSQKYKVTSQKRLVDLNGTSVNFNLNFNAQSVNGEPFEVLVVDQATLDSENELSYKKALDGKINGNVIADKNIYQNYFLILRSDQECEVILQIDKKELPLLQDNNSNNPPIENNTQDYNNSPPIENNTQDYNNSPPLGQIPQFTGEKPKPKSNLKFYLIILVVGVGLGLLYYFYNKSNNAESAPEIHDIVNGSTPASVSVTPNTSPVPASVTSTPKTFSMSGSNTLLDRLAGLNIP